MGTPLKIKIRKFMKEMKCPHLNYSRRSIWCGVQDFIRCECEDCGKVWIE